jgi:hypothetical protein
MENNTSNDGLAGWITSKVDAWEEWRDMNYQDRWDEYYRLWRGIWTESDKSRNGERSRIICPELAQTVETMVAELEDATFIRERWIDVSDDIADQEKEDIGAAINTLVEEFNLNGVPNAISESYFNGALYGTGIAKIIVDRIKVPSITNEGLPAVEFKEKYVVKVIPISPRNFAIDPVARNVNEALGCAHVLQVPLTSVQKKISDGIYRNIPLAPFNDTIERLDTLGEYNPTDTESEAVKVVEYHGLVPKSMLTKKETLFDKIDEAIQSVTEDRSIKAVEGGSLAGEELVEAIVTIINDEHVARAVENPFLMGDRSIVSYQHDTVPDRFWGRGVAEKGYNPQKALDAEIRARIDALGLSTHPMMAIDATKIPRGETFAVRPGRNILTQGNPAEALMPLKFPPPDPHTFQQTQELREMIQRGTGGYELPAAMADANRMAATSMSMVVGSMIKRSRRTLANIEREFLKPIVEKALWRYMQFNPELFPMKDYKFQVRATMGIMAREFEQGQLVSLLSTVPPESPAYWMLIKGIYSNSAIEDREAMIKLAEQNIESAMNPQPPPPDPKVLLDKEKLEFEKEKWLDERDLQTRKLEQIDEGIKAEAKRDIGEGYMQTATAMLQSVKAETEQLRAQAEAFKMIAEAQKAQVEAQMAGFTAQIQAMATISASKQKDVSEESESETSKPDGTKTIKRTRKTPVEVEDSGMEVPEMEEMPANPILEKITLLLENQMKMLSMNTASSSTNSPDLSGVFEKLATVIERLDGKVGEQGMAIDGLSKPKKPRKAPKIDRGPDGMVAAVDGIPVTRDAEGRLAGLAEAPPEE